MVGRARALLTLAPAVLAAGCGGGDDAVDEAAVRECLAAAGVEIEAAATTSPTLGNASPDFRASVEGLPVDLIVERDQDRAQRTAADLRGALGTFGVQNVDQRLLEEGNAIAVFVGDPTAAQREVVAGCMS